MMDVVELMRLIGGVLVIVALLLFNTLAVVQLVKWCGDFLKGLK
ncbi:MAG: hypothetical protein QM639_15420 [Rhodocyclaceae bacterium]